MSVGLSFIQLIDVILMNSIDIENFYDFLMNDIRLNSDDCDID